MSRFSDIAKRSVSGGGGLTAGLTRLKVDDVIAEFPDGITITGVDKIPYEDDYFYSFTFAEAPDKCFSGGKALRDMADGWFAACDDDATAVNDELAVEHVRIRLEKTKTKAKRTFTKVVVLGSVAAAKDVHCNPETGEVIDAPF